MRGAAAEAAALGARLATGAQVVLERAESMLGGNSGNEGGAGSGFVGARPGPGLSAFRGPLMAIPTTAGGEWDASASVMALTAGAGDDEGNTSEEGSGDERMISRYSEQPKDMREGIQSASRALRRNATAAAQTILAIPMEVYEQTENEVSFYSISNGYYWSLTSAVIGADTCGCACSAYRSTAAYDWCDRSYWTNATGGTKLAGPGCSNRRGIEVETALRLRTADRRSIICWNLASVYDLYRRCSCCIDWLTM